MNELDGFRAEIDRIDTELARLLELRFDLCEEIGRYKRMNGLPIENCEREKELVAARTEGMLSHQSDAVAVFRMIIRRAKRIQKEKLNLYLVGMPGSGKSRTARRLARAIEKPVADTDKLIIDKQGMSIDEIFTETEEMRLYLPLIHTARPSSARLKAKLCSALRNAADMLLQPEAEY